MTIIPSMTSLRPKVHRAGRYRKSVSFTVCFPFAKRQSLSRYLLAYIISHLFVKNNIFPKNLILERLNPWTIQKPPLLSYQGRGWRIYRFYKKKCPQNHRNERFKGENEAFSVYKAKFHSRNCIDYGIFFWLRGGDLNLLTSGLWARRATKLLYPAILSHFFCVHCIISHEMHFVNLFFKNFKIIFVVLSMMWD